MGALAVGAGLELFDQLIAADLLFVRECVVFDGDVESEGDSRLRHLSFPPPPPNADL